METISILALILSTPLEVGSRAPDFVARDTTGRTIQLSQLLTRGPVVITFYPKAFTSGCTRQMKQYGQLQQRFVELNTQVVAVSADDLETQRDFRKQMGASFPFIADPDGEIIEQYGIKTPIFTFAKRRTFVIGTDGLIKSIESGDNVIDVSSTVEAVRQTCGG